MNRSLFLIILATVTACFPLHARSHKTPSGFEVGGGPRLLMPREEFSNGWGLGLDGTWNLSPRYGFTLKYDVFQVTPKSGRGSKTVSSLMGNMEFSFRRGQFVHGFTSLGMGAVSEDEDPLFVFGIGIKVPLTRRLLLRFELKDFFTQLGIPFLSFPGGFAALQGQGRSRYLQSGLGVNLKLGRDTPPGVPRR